MSSVELNNEQLTAWQKREKLQNLLRQKARKSQRTIPLTVGQKALWFLNQSVPNSPAYHVGLTLRIKSKVNELAMRAALQRLIDRHALLRATFQVSEGQPNQVVSGSSTVSFTVVDAKGWDETRIHENTKAEYEIPFNLSNGPLIRAHLFQCTDTDCVFLLAVHHIIYDAWSLWLNLDELSTLYIAEITSTNPNLPTAIHNYSHYVAAQEKSLAGPEGERLWRYWQKQLAGEILPISLPTDKPRPAKQRYLGASCDFQLNTQSTAALKDISKQYGVTPFTLLFSVYQVMLYRYSGQEEFLIGTPTGGGNRADYADVVGYFVNQVPLRVQLKNNPCFTDVLRQSWDTVLEALEHQDFPFSQLVERLCPERDLSFSPLVQVSFVFQQSQHSAGIADLLSQTSKSRTVEWAGLDVEYFHMPQQEGQFDLELEMMDGGDNFFGVFKYNTDLYEQDTIIRMIGHFKQLLSSVVENPKQNIDQLTYLSHEEHELVVTKWNDTNKNYNYETCLHTLCELQANKTPSSVAVKFGQKSLTYYQLNARANQLAHHLISLGVGPDGLVGIMLERSIDMVVGLLAILKAGGAYVPIDPSYPKDRITYMLEDSSVPVLLTQEKFISLVGSSTNAIQLDVDWVSIAEQDQQNPIRTTTPYNLAYMIYTSGSTGRPKGSLNTHRAICNRLLWMQDEYHLTTSDKVLQKTPFSFDVSVWEFFWPLMTGACLVVAKPDGHKDSAYLASLIAKQRITTTHFVPSMLQVFLEEQGIDKCHSLKRVICSGEALSVELQQRFFERLPAELYNLYGPTEAAIDVTYWQCDRKSKSTTVPIGRPISNTQIYILDKHNQATGIGIPGELHIAGVGLARGYHNREELTAEKFIANPFSNDKKSKLYKSGDMALLLPDGRIEYLGRIDHQIKIRGIRLELGEIESVIGEYPGIRECVVTVREDHANDKRLVAYITGNTDTLNSSILINEVDLRSHLKDQLPDYAIPSTIVQLDTLPLSANGKVDRKALPAPDTTQKNTSNNYVPPRDDIERKLVAIWEPILHRQPIGVQDNFFDIGGHSLLAIQVMAQIEKIFSKNLELSVLFNYSTIEQLADSLRQQTTPSPWSPLVAIQPAGSLTPFFCVAGGGGNVLYYYELAQRLGTARPFYGLQARGLDGESEPFSQVEDMARHNIEAIKSVQPHGPYLIGGHCFGGLVAFEMAQQLKQQGEEIALLAIIDIPAPAPNNTSALANWDNATWLVKIASALEQAYGQSLQFKSLEELQSLSDQAQLEHLKDRMQANGMLPPAAGVNQVRGFVNVFKANSRANYQPNQTKPVPTVLLRASEAHPDYDYSGAEDKGGITGTTSLGWRNYCPEDLTVQIMAGNHLTMLSGDNAVALSKALSQHLNKSTVDSLPITQSSSGG